MDCTICHDEHHILNPKTGMYRECECLRVKRHRRKLVEAGVPKYMLNMTWKEWKDSHPGSALAADNARAWAQKAHSHVNRCFGLCGSSGSGKLTLAYLMVRECVTAKMSAKVVTISELVQDRWKDDTLITEALDADVLCMRLGMEESHKWTTSFLERVHFGRKVDHKPTIYTMRSQGEIFGEKYGDVLYKVFWTAKRDVEIWDLSDGLQVVA